VCSSARRPAHEHVRSYKTNDENDGDGDFDDGWRNAN
jgi:hypothetical protein